MYFDVAGFKMQFRRAAPGRNLFSLIAVTTLATLLAAVFFHFTVPRAEAQRFEVLGAIGGQFNGGLDFSTTLVQGLDVQNNVSRALGISFEPRTHAAVEFMWTYNNPDTVARLANGPSTKLFTLDMNQYFGNVLFHFATREQPLRPYALAGLGASDVSPARNGVVGSTRLAFALGGGVKYNFSRWFGLRFQAKWSPTYFANTNIGYWCNPTWGGCWEAGKNHYLQQIDTSVGLTFRF